jgi:hypothetical protein
MDQPPQEKSSDPDDSMLHFDDRLIFISASKVQVVKKDEEETI